MTRARLGRIGALLAMLTLWSGIACADEAATGPATSVETLLGNTPSVDQQIGDRLGLPDPKSTGANGQPFIPAGAVTPPNNYDPTKTGGEVFVLAGLIVVLYVFARFMS